jgi:hypothetical protein
MCGAQSAHMKGYADVQMSAGSVVWWASVCLLFAAHTKLQTVCYGSCCCAVHAAYATGTGGGHYCCG